MFYFIFIAICSIQFPLSQVDGFLSITEKERLAQHNYSNHQCIGGSQVLETYPMSWAMRQGKQLSKFPMNDPEFRTCKFRNLCLIDGHLTYYINNYTAKHIPVEYLPEGMQKGGGAMFHVGHLRGNTLPIKTVTGHIPVDGSITWHNPSVPIFLDANSWSFNFGHYLIDNVIPSWIASRIFNIPFGSIQQLFETKCKQFTILDRSFADNQVGYNKSLGTYSEACLSRIEGMHGHFYKHSPLFLDELHSYPATRPTNPKEKKSRPPSICFRTLVAGHGSTFGLKSVDLSRAVVVREFRDYVVGSMPSDMIQAQENIILVGLRTQGAAGGKIVNDLCSRVKDALAKLDEFYTARYRVECFVPAELSLYQEITMVRRARVLVSVHGTISYMSLFSRDGTQQISITDPKEHKENQILLYLTHIYMVYLQWDRIHQLGGVLGMALSRAEEAMMFDD